MNAQDDWSQWKQHVLAELQRLNEASAQQNALLMQMHVELAGLKVRAGVWGAVAGLIPGLVALLATFLKEG